ncbi:substrate-binding domain-containing protein [Psychromonas aquimarina]|uniref:substrate-binding domain-containing protein n=1 Tax=Psychromonas aquimarina TaxID=444919 RepID=UPI00041FF60D|nr:substrate-binding domain-containing protein [Psychromonas aquimarina]
MLRITIISLFLLCTTQVHSRADFWSLNEYWQEYPYQQELSESFSDIVRNPPAPLSYTQDKPVFIYFITPSRQLSDYWRRNRTAFTERLNELNIKYKIKSYDTKANSQEAQKRKLMQRALSENPDFIILTLDTAPDRNFTRRILNQKKTRIIVQNVTNPVKSWHKNQPLLYVGFDHESGTKILAEYFKKTFSGKTKYAVNNFYPGYISKVRGNSFITMLEKNSRFELLSHVYTDASQGSARSNTLNLVDLYPDLNFIYASATDIAIGTSKALQRLGREDIKVNGWGGGTMELQALAKGELDVTVMRMNDDSGVAMAEAVKLVLEKKEELVPVVYSGEFKLVTSETKPSEVEKLIKHAFRYSDPHVKEQQR